MIWLRSENNADTLNHDSYTQKLKKWAPCRKSAYIREIGYMSLTGETELILTWARISLNVVFLSLPRARHGRLRPLSLRNGHPASEARQLGLRRTQTLAERGDKCDFRFKSGRKTAVKSTVWNSYLASR